MASVGGKPPNRYTRHFHLVLGANRRPASMSTFVLQWAVSSFCLWASSYVFSGIRFADGGSLIVAALLLGVVNALVRPVLILFTLPITLLTLGGFLLVINALMIMLVAALVRGFTVSGFWTALFASLFISVLGTVLISVLEKPAAGSQQERRGGWL